MTIQLNPEQERIAGQAMRAGLIRSLDDVAEVGLAAIRSKLKSRNSAHNAEQTDEWLREFTAWFEGHSNLTPPLPDEAINRDSIYDTRGC